MSGNVGDQRNWLEKLGDKIPGYSGYVDRERRRDIDKLQRDHLADQVRAIKGPANDVMRELSSGGRLFEVGPVDRILKKLDQLENRIRFASYGYTGFFDVVKIHAEQLDAIYRFDLALVEQVDKLDAKVRELKAQSATADGLKASASEIDTFLDELERTFDARQGAIGQTGQDVPPGRPLFNG
ncbi:MAG: hypothetical protein DMF61_05320 [Blastocatellia bacterium AA13]|nr:MAG: hypothetical protein DMF61_05320 [Blastocatellia bacterium AA13]